MRQLIHAMAAMVALAGVAGGLSACAGIHLSDLTDTPTDTTTQTVTTANDHAGAAGSITGSVAPSATAPLAAAGDHGDWEVIRTTVAAALAQPATARLEWTNHASGNSGTITELAPSAVKGHDCRSFASTIAAVDGVRLYHAEICRSVMNTWEFSKIAAADVQ